MLTNFMTIILVVSLIREIFKLYRFAPVPPLLKVARNIIERQLSDASLKLILLVGKYFPQSWPIQLFVE
jgi:hypothetical protein